jgi:hypothetical protein
MVQIMLKRSLNQQLISAFGQYPVVTLIGPRQSGKRTLARNCFPELPYVNLEDPEIRRFISEDPRAFLNEYARDEEAAIKFIRQSRNTYDITPIERFAQRNPTYPPLPRLGDPPKLRGEPVTLPQ